MNLFKSEFFEAVSLYSPDSVKANFLWTEIVEAYSHKKRFYHNLGHLENLHEIITPFKNRFRDWNAVIFSIAYHDFIYHVVRSDNEERSARHAETRLKEIAFNHELVNFCKDLILATKHHLDSSLEINLFTDADLSILGAEETTYLQYMENIRSEYSIFPALIYNPGRRKVLMHFLEMKRIFKTDEFFYQYEEQARSNLEMELNHLK